MTWLIRAIEDAVEVAVIERLHERISVSLVAHNASRGLSAVVDFGDTALGEWQWLDVHDDQLFDTIVNDMASRETSLGRKEMQAQLVRALRELADEIERIVPEP